MRGIVRMLADPEHTESARSKTKRPMLQEIGFVPIVERLLVVPYTVAIAPMPASKQPSGSAAKPKQKHDSPTE